MKHLNSNSLRRSMLATCIDIAIAATISVSFMASAQSSTAVLNRDADFSASSPDPLEGLYDAGQHSKSSMPEQESDVIEFPKRNSEWSSSAQVGFSEGSMEQPPSDVVALLWATSGKSGANGPKSRPFPRLDRILLVGVAAVRLEDAVTTPLLFKNGAQEDMLPDRVARSPLYMLALGALATSAQYRFSAIMIRHNHGRIARATEVMHILSVGYFATQNISAHAIYVNR